MLLRKRTVIIAACGLLSMAALLTGGLVFSGILLVTQDVPQSADMIVVLGGEVSGRAEKAIELYRKGLAPHLLITGATDAERIRQRIIAGGVPASAISLETEASSTFENGKFSSKLLVKKNVRSLLLVTSWFHSRRASLVFKRLLPQVKVISAPTETVPPSAVLTNKWISRQVMHEYVKSIGYMIRYGLLSA